MTARPPIRGFLPAEDPIRAFPRDSELSSLDEVGRDLPSLLEDPSFRKYAREIAVPEWPGDEVAPERLGELRLYYVRLAFLASAYVNQLSQPRATSLPKNIAVPLCRASKLLRRPPILSYDGYALYNWKRFDTGGAVSLGNIDTLQNFVHMYDEHWFILVHVEIEAIAARILPAIARAQRAVPGADETAINEALGEIDGAVTEQIEVLRRIPEKMDLALYYRTFRPYIRFFENVVYEDVAEVPMDFRGETGAQSSILPSLVAFMKIDHQQSELTDHLSEMRRYMPAEHRALIESIEAGPDVRALADKDLYNNVLEAMAVFREVHYRWAQEYIEKWSDDPLGTGGTPYAEWLGKLIEETRAHKIR